MAWICSKACRTVAIGATYLLSVRLRSLLSHVKRILCGTVLCVRFCMLIAARQRQYVTHATQQALCQATSFTRPLCAVMSANDCVETVQECLQRGASHYILKPVTKKEVQAIWQHAFRPRVIGPTPSSTAQAPDADVFGPRRQRKAADSAEVQTAETPGSPEAAESGALAGTSARNVALGSGIDLPLHDALETHMLSWQQRLVTFCHLLRSSLQAFSSRGASAAPSPRPFFGPDGVYVTEGGLVSNRADQHPGVPHCTSRHYRAPEAAQHGPVPASEPTCVYALGALLFELASGPATAAERADRLTKLPHLPADLLTSWPSLAILILRMTAQKARDRPRLAEVVSDAAVQRVYRGLEARLDAAARAHSAVAAAAQFSFLTLAETVQQRRVQVITEMLAQLDQDLQLVRSGPFHSD